MRITNLFVATALLASVSIVGAQDKGKGKGGGKGFQLPPMIHITIADFPDGGHIPAKYTCAAGQNSPSPAMTWTGAPANTESYVVILHDPDPVLQGSAVNDVLHWAIFDIPGSATGLPEGVKMGTQADGSVNIKNMGNTNGYMGPCAPPGHGDHHYTFEVYALSAKLGLPDTTSRADLLAAMNGKVIAKGVYIGMFGQK
jgi:hypothetical protein